MSRKRTLSQAGVADYPLRLRWGCYVEGDNRSRLHEVVDALAEDELPIARQLLELLARGLATSRPTMSNGTDVDLQVEDDDDDDDDDEVDEGDEGDTSDPMSSPAVIAKLAQLTDDELLRLDELLGSDREAARQF